MPTHIYFKIIFRSCIGFMWLIFYLEVRTQAFMHFDTCVLISRKGILF